MRTTVDIDRELIEEVMRATGEARLGKAINKALKEYVRRSKIEELRQLLGTFGLADTWREDEQRELEDMRKNAL